MYAARRRNHAVSATAVISSDLADLPDSARHVAFSHSTRPARLRWQWRNGAPDGRALG